MQCFYLVLGAATFLAHRQCLRVPETTLAANSGLATLVFPSVSPVTIIFWVMESPAWGLTVAEYTVAYALAYICFNC